MNHTIGILICGHGSSDPDSHAPFFAWLQDLRGSLDYPCVAGFLEAQQPSIVSAAEELIANGATRIFALPAMLLTGRHSQRDIPLELAKLDDAVAISYLPEVIDHPKLLLAAKARILEAAGGKPLCNVNLLLVAHGSRNSEANQKVIDLGKQLARETGVVDCEVAFGQIGAPTIGTCLNNIVDGNWIVLPYFLFAGKPLKQVQKEIAQFIETRALQSIMVAEPLGGHPLITQAFCDVLNQAIDNDQ